MSKKLLLIIIGVAILAGGAMAFMLTRDEPSPVSQSDQLKASGDKATFNALSTADQAFVAKMTTTTDGNTVNATIESDGQGNVHYKSTLDGQTSDMYLTEQGLISCSNEQCLKLPQNGAIDRDTFEYDDSDIQNFRDNATYEGREACPDGTCAVWNVEDNDSQFTTRVFLDGDGRPSKLTSEGPQGRTEITYEYRAVNVNIPTNVKELPTAS